MSERTAEQKAEAEHLKKLWHEVNELASPKTRAQRKAEAAARDQRYYDPTPAPTRSDKLKAELIDPAWRHANAGTAKERPKVVFEGDDLILEVKTKEIADGSGIDFIIENRSDPAPFATKQNAHDRARNGIVGAKWKVTIKRSRNNHGEKPKLVFHAEYEGFSGAAKSPDIEIPLFNKIACTVVEIPDACWNAGSPVPCLDKNGLLEGALVAILTHAKDNPTKQVIVLGHSDPKEAPADRFDQSKYAAEMVRRCFVTPNSVTPRLQSFAPRSAFNNRILGKLLLEKLPLLILAAASSCITMNVVQSTLKEKSMGRS
jgi:hypothetical protein